MKKIFEAIKSYWMAMRNGFREASQRGIYCGRCGVQVDINPPLGPMTAGYYNCTGDPAHEWACYAKPGEKYLCDTCMWNDPSYIAKRGPVPGVTNVTIS